MSEELDFHEQMFNVNEQFSSLKTGDNESQIDVIRRHKNNPIEESSKKTTFQSPPPLKSMKDLLNERHFKFMIRPFEYNPSKHDEPPVPINAYRPYQDRWDKDHVQMPCSPFNVTKNRQSVWSIIYQALTYLKSLCDKRFAIVNDLKTTITRCTGVNYDLTCLEKLINECYSHEERGHFMSTVLSNICSLALDVGNICSQSVPLLRIATNQLVTMSQKQAASLLACSFFCLFPPRTNQQSENFQNPNFDLLYANGPREKLEKLKCILHYFKRITTKMPSGVLTFFRSAKPKKQRPNWNSSQSDLVDLQLTSDTMIEDVPNALQVDFANKYIGGGVLGNGCVQEEIRFSICPEMLVSLLVCEVMEDNECVFLIGCERFSNYRGYANSFEFDSDYVDRTPSDSWGRKWCHLVAIDALFFRDRTEQYSMDRIDRELFKAFIGFNPIGDTPEYRFPIATGNWGCGVFNGDRQLKAMIQWIAASEAQRPLIYAAYRDKDLVKSGSAVYQYLKDSKATVRDLYQYLRNYCRVYKQGSLFDYILKTPVSSIRN